MRMKVVLLVLLLIITALPAGAQVSYDRKSGSLSALFNGVPLRDVMAEISKKTGIAVYIDPAVDKTVYIEKRNRPVDEVLSEIISPLNNMLIYRDSTVVAVRIYDQVPADAVQIVSPGAQQGAVSAPHPPAVRGPQPRMRPPRPRQED